MAVNKVIIKGETKLDLTGDTIAPEYLVEGITAHDKSGNPIVGIAKLGGGSITVLGSTTKPSNPEENTVWVTTSMPFNEIYLQAAMPSYPVLGDIWINTGVGYNSSGNANVAEENTLTIVESPHIDITIGTVAQWDGTAWTYPGVEIYKNGEWHSEVFYIFHAGVWGNLGPFTKSYAWGYNNKTGTGTPGSTILSDGSVKSYAAGGVASYYLNGFLAGGLDVTRFNTLSVSARQGTYPGTSGFTGTTYYGIASTQGHTSGSYLVSYSGSLTDTGSGVFSTQTTDISSASGVWYPCVTSYCHEGHLFQSSSTINFSWMKEFALLV